MNRDPIIKLTCVIALTTVGVLCCRLFEFTQPILNYSFVLLVAILPFLAINPIGRLPEWPRRIGLTLLSPLLVIELIFILGFAACGSPELHHYESGSCIQEEQRLEQDDYSVHLLIDCGGGATVRNSEWIEQRRRIVPGLYLVRRLDSFYGAAEGGLYFADRQTLRYHRSVVDETGIQDYTYKLKPHIYF